MFHADNGAGLRCSDDASTILKASIRATLFSDELGAIKALNWRHPILLSSNLLATGFLLFGWIFLTANKIGFSGAFNHAVVAVPVDFSCMLLNVGYLHKHTAAAVGRGVDENGMQREFMIYSVATGLLFVSCCMVSVTGTSLGRTSNLGASIRIKVPGLAMMNAGVACSWLGLLVMVISLFGTWTKWKTDAGAADTAADVLTYQEEEEEEEEEASASLNSVSGGVNTGASDGAAYEKEPSPESVNVLDNVADAPSNIVSTQADEAHSI
jgi:hypothetical protein